MWPLTELSVSQGYRKDASAVLAFAHLEAKVRPICRLLVTQNQQLGSRKAYRLYLREEVGNAFWGLIRRRISAKDEGIGRVL